MSNVVAKTGLENDFCSGCGLGSDCKKAYEQLAGCRGPSVVIRVTVAFLLPITVFIVALGVSEKLFRRILTDPALPTVFGAVIAGCLTFICILITRAIYSRQDGMGRLSMKGAEDN
ncbi:MAG: hypothetical protein KAT00_12315 [Planctomycetes bacterium]|nr:hypothetical protein [Planctomycetota bacterium]